MDNLSVVPSLSVPLPRGTKNLPAKCKAVHEIVRSENRQVMGPDASMMDILLLGAEKVDVRSRDLPRPT